MLMEMRKIPLLYHRRTTNMPYPIERMTTPTRPTRIPNTFRGLSFTVFARNIRMVMHVRTGKASLDRFYPTQLVHDIPSA